MIENKTLSDFCCSGSSCSSSSDSKKSKPKNPKYKYNRPKSAVNTNNNNSCSPSKTKIPLHVAVVLDGNRRFAKTFGLPTPAGHFAGAMKMFDISDWLFSRGVKTASYYAWAIKNFSRDEEEKRMLFAFFKVLPTLVKDTKTDLIKKHGILFKIAGNLDLFPLDVRIAFKQIEFISARILKDNNIKHRHTINLCVAYGFEDELYRATVKAVNKKGSIKSIDDIFSELDVSEPVDLFIRPGKETRDSGFLPIQSAQAEKVYYPKLLPELEEGDIDRILNEYANRDIRLGGGEGRPLPCMSTKLIDDLDGLCLSDVFKVVEKVCSGDIKSVLIDAKMYIDRLFCSTIF